MRKPEQAQEEHNSKSQEEHNSKKAFFVTDCLYKDIASSIVPEEFWRRVPKEDLVVSVLIVLIGLIALALVKVGQYGLAWCCVVTMFLVFVFHLVFPRRPVSATKDEGVANGQASQSPPQFDVEPGSSRQLGYPPENDEDIKQDTCDPASLVVLPSSGDGTSKRQPPFSQR